MNGIFKPLLAALEAKGYPVAEYNDGDYFKEEILALNEYRTPYIKFGPIKDTKEKNVGKFLFDSSEIREMSADELTDWDSPKAAQKQFLGILMHFNDRQTNACPIRIEGLNQRWYLESEIVFTEDGNLEFKVFVNCPSADPQNEQRFNPYGYYEDLWKICKAFYESVNDLQENVRFMKMY